MGIWLRALLVPLGYVAVWLGYYLFALFMLRIAFSTRRLPIYLLLASLLVAQFCMKLIDRYYLVAFSMRSGDESFWLRTLGAYQTTGEIPIEAIAQGPGIFYLVTATSNFLHFDYGSTLVILAIGFGSAYVVPAFLLYRVLFKGDERLAFATTLLLSMSDVMIYSTTIARPTLFGLFLIPLAVGAFQALRGRFRWRMFGLLIFVSVLILFVHTPITFVVLLAVVSFTILIFDKTRKWEATYTLILFSSYGIMLRLFLPDLDRIWRTELFASYPLDLISAFSGENFFLVFPVVGLGVLALSLLLPLLTNSGFAKRRSKSIQNGSRRAYYVMLVLILMAGLTLGSVVWKYAAYILSNYGGVGLFLLLHGWKIPFGVIGLLGLRRVGTRFSRTANDTILPWLLSMAVIVATLSVYAPIWARFLGLWNLDERFAEFAYYPAFYFVTLGLNCLATRLSQRRFHWILPLIALYTIPSFIVGTSILAFL